MQIDFHLIAQLYQSLSNDKLETLEYMCEYFDLDYTNDIDAQADILDLIYSESYEQKRCLFWLPRVGVSAVFETVLMHDKLGFIQRIKTELFVQNYNAVVIPKELTDTEIRNYYEELFDQHLSEDYTEQIGQRFADRIGNHNGKSIQKEGWLLAERIHYAQPKELPRGDIQFYLFWLQRNYINYLSYCAKMGQDALYKRTFLSFIHSYESRFLQGIQWDEEIEVNTKDDEDFVYMQVKSLKQLKNRIINDSQTNHAGKPFTD